jgi:hypothetical protein
VTSTTAVQADAGVRAYNSQVKAVEVRVPQFAGFGEDMIGVDLMNDAFGSRPANGFHGN